ncbi:MAG: glycosyltransferase 87 family protein [Candidatus Dormibacteria bacterium]
MAGRHPSATALVTGAAALVAAAVAALQLTRPGQLPGTSYDTAVFLGGAIRLVHGAVPYRDFAFVQPPGLLLLLSPFGLLSELVGTRLALDALILCTPLLAAANVVLVGRLLRHRGWTACLAGCGLLAVYPAVFFALRDGMVEPVMDLCCLVGLCLAFREDRLAGPRRLILGGVALGVAATVMLPGLIPALAVAAVAARHPRRGLLPLAGGLAAGVGVPSLPFALLSPGGFVDGVFVSQLARVPDAARQPLSLRAVDLTVGGGQGWTVVVVAVVILAAIALVAVSGLLVPPRRRLPALEWFALGAAAAMLAAQFVTSQYFPHYPAMVAPFLAVLLGISAGRLAAWRLPRLLPAAVTGFALWLLAAQVVGVEGLVSVRVSAAAVDAVVPAGACAVADRTYLLVGSDRFVSTRPGCPELVDPRGTVYANAETPGGAAAAFGAAITGADYVVVDMSLDQWLPGAAYAPVRADVAEQFHLVRSGRLYCYVRDGFAAAATPAAGAGTARSAS